MSSSARSKSLVWARKAFCCRSISATAWATREASDLDLPEGLGSHRLELHAEVLHRVLVLAQLELALGLGLATLLLELGGEPLEAAGKVVQRLGDARGKVRSELGGAVGEAGELARYAVALGLGGCRVGIALRFVLGAGPLDEGARGGGEGVELGARLGLDPGDGLGEALGEGPGGLGDRLAGGPVRAPPRRRGRSRASRRESIGPAPRP